MRQQRGMQRVQFVVLALAVMVVASGVPARADESRRRQLREEIERLLSDVASELRDVPGDSSTSDLDRTIDYAGRVSEKARDLKNVAGDDSDARRMGESYPDIASRYKDAAGYLRELKNGHRKVDEWPRKCEQAVRELTTRMRTFTDSPDPRGVDEVPRLAREFGRVGKEAMEQAERTRNEMYTWYDRADDFSYSDGKWSDVRNNLVTAARTMYEHTLKQAEQVKRADVCGDLAKEERNPLVEDAMKKLYEGKKGIELVYEQLDRQLGELASYLDRLEGDSSDADVSSAEGKLGEIDGLLHQLDRIKGNDGEAKRRVETWRDLVRAGREGMKPLRVLKQSQFLADQAPAKCKATSDQLEDIIRGFVDKGDKKGISVIPLRAKGFAEPIKAGLAKTDEQHRVMERALSDALRFDPSEGRWRDVAARHKASATAVFEHWKKAREAAHAHCDELAKGEGAERIRKAIEKLKLGATSEIDRFRQDVDTWIADARSLFQMDCTELESIWLAMCGADEERNEQPDREEARNTAREIGRRMRERIDPIRRRHDDLKKRGEVLAQDDETKDRATAILRGMNELHEKFDRLERGGALKGADHPMSQYAAEHGKQMHDDYAGKYRCNVYDQPYDGAGGRPDCIVVGSTCYVYEFKPETPAARRKGTEQLDRYVPAVTRYYQQRIDAKQGSDSTKQGAITDDVARQCVKGGQVVFERRVIAYPLCEKKFECVK